MHIWISNRQPDGTWELGGEPLAFTATVYGSVGDAIVESSAIVVQGIAANTIGIESTSRKLFKELSVALINGMVLSSLLLAYNLIRHEPLALTITVSTALFSVILFASLFGTFIPLALNRIKIDPALATGPFITTMNDIISMVIYLVLGRMMYAMI